MQFVFYLACRLLYLGVGFFEPHGKTGDSEDSLACVTWFSPGRESNERIPCSKFLERDCQGKDNLNTSRSRGRHPVRSFPFVINNSLLLGPQYTGLQPALGNLWEYEMLVPKV